MLNARDEIFAQIKTFISKCVETEEGIYNSAFIVAPPTQTKRIEFSLDNFRGIGHNYRNNDKSGRRYRQNSKSVYSGVLEIRIIDTPVISSQKVTRIISGLNHSDFRNKFMPDLSIQSSTIRNSRHMVEENNNIYGFERITVNVYFSSEFEFNSDYFDTIINTSIDIKEG